MADQETIREQKALSTADNTGLSDIFSYQNAEEISAPFVDIADPDDIESEDRKLTEIPTDEPQLRARGREDMGLFERVYGYNPERDMPWGYERMSKLERGVMKAQLAAQNVFTRFGIGAQRQLKGTVQLFTPKSVEQYLTDDTQKNEGRLEEDKYYERRIQQSLLKNENRTPAEEQQLAYLNETLPSGFQKSPEFVGRLAGEIERIALAGELFKMIPIPGGGTLNEHLSEVGRRTMGRRLAFTANGLQNRPVATAVLDSLARGMEQLGPIAGELFVWGFISAEKEEGEEAERTAAERVEAGTKMTGWALLPLLLAPTAKGLQATSAGAATLGFMKRVVTKVTTPIADKLARMTAGKAKRKVIQQGLVEADDLFFQENKRLMTPVEKKAVKETLEEVVEETSKIVRESSDDIIAKMEELSGKEIGSNPVGAESVIPKVLRSVETVGDDVVNSTTALVEKRTNFVTVRQADGNYSILEKDTFKEVAVAIKRKNLAKELDDLIFGVGEKAPKKAKLDVTKRPKPTRLIAEEVELRRSLRRMEVATNKAFRAGVKDANEKAAVKIQAGKERLQTIKAGNREQWKNVEFARELVKDFVPKKDQHLFLNRLIKAKTEGGLDKIFDDIGKHIDRAKVNNAVDSIRGALKTASKKFKNQTGKFAGAPDEIRPILENLDKAMAGITKRVQEAGTDISGFGQLADDMVTGLNSALAGKGEVLGIPANLAEDLYSLSTKQGEAVTADTIDTLAQLTNLVIHRAEQAHLIDISGELVAATKAIDDSITRVVPRKPAPKTNSLGQKFKRLYGPDSDHPVTLVEKIFGQGSDMSLLLDDLYEGETQAFGVMRNSYDFVRSYMKNNNLDDDIFTGLKKKVEVTIAGKPVKIARDDLLGLAMSSRDPWVFDQMTKTSGYNIGGLDISRATNDELGQMFSLLTPSEMKLGSVMFELNNNYLSQIVNETSIKLNGIKLATYPQYYPSHRSLNKKLYGNKWAFRTAETQSNFMPRMGGKGRMKFNSFSREMMDYIQNSAMYNGTSVPMRSIKTVLGDKLLQDTARNGGYADELGNFIDILSRSEGLYSDGSVLDVIGSDILNRFTKGVLGGRVSTIGTQIGSIPAAKAVIPGKFFKVRTPNAISGAVDDLLSSDFFWYRWTGRRVSVELGDTASRSSLSHFIFNKTPLTEKPLTGLVWGDKQAIGSIYLNARDFLTATTKLQGDDLTRGAIKLTEKATRETQPNWSILTRSKLASDPSVFKRSLTMFRTAQEAQFNIWKRATVKFSQSAGTAKDVGELAKSYQAVLESQMSVAIWKATWKRGREAGISGVAGWLGIYVPEDEDPFAEDLTKSAARTVAGTVPLGQVMETAVEAAYDQLFKDGATFNLKADPLSALAQASFSASTSVFKWSKQYLDSQTKREGFTADLLPATIEDILDEISTSEADRKQKRQELINQITKDVVKAARAAGLVTGVAVGPLDEWVAPGLKRSQFALVGRVNQNNSSDPAGLQRDLHKFLTRKAKLEKKSDEKGLTQKEALTAFNMNLIQKTIIDPAFAIDDIAGDDGDKVLDSIGDQLKQFIGEPE